MAERAVPRVQQDPGGPSRTKQSFGADADINAIMRKYQSTGMIEYKNRAAPRYGDFSSGLDYSEAMMKVKEADRLFLLLPSKVRGHFNNDPAQLLNAVFDPARRSELEALGLVSEAPQVEPGAPISPEDGSGDPPA
ncbi:VP3 [Gokushovirus WZ-2015a]|nr:VP3 [Gokushovirus WZ-2015a]